MDDLLGIIIVVVGFIILVALQNKRHKEEANSPYKWIDDPYMGWMASKWDLSHTIGLLVATFFFIIPGIIFLLWKISARSSYLQEKKYADQKQNIAFERTGCNYIWSVFHFGEHPKLPLSTRVLIGLRPPEVIFYDFKLNELHSLPIKAANASIKTFQNVRGGAYVTTTNKMTVIWREVINERAINAEFDFEPYNPRQFVHVINEFSTS
jgi:hypothetical protein